jgi:hypothetical protein
MNILIDGDSWACGEFSRPGQLPVKMLHLGLEQYAKDAGHNAINISVGGSSNYQIANRLNIWINRHIDEKIDLVLVFQTDVMRDSAMLFEEDFDQITHAHSLINIWLSRFYTRLSEISQRLNCPVKVIGGVVDTIWLDNMQDYYPGVSIVCQSMVNLIMNQDHQIETPVLSWFDPASIDVVSRIKEKLENKEIEKLLNMIDQGMTREDLIFGNPKYFWPDGKHPNRLGHKILFDFLQTQISGL